MSFFLYLKKCVFGDKEMMGHTYETVTQVNHNIGTRPQNGGHKVYNEIISIGGVVGGW